MTRKFCSVYARVWYRTSFHLIVLRFNSHFVPQFKPILQSLLLKSWNKMFMFYLVCLFTWFFNSGSCFFFLCLIVLLLLLFVTSLKRFSLSDDQVQQKTLPEQLRKNEISTVIKAQAKRISDKTFTSQTSTRKLHFERMKREAFNIFTRRMFARKKRVDSPAQWMNAFTCNENTLVCAF